MELLVLVPPGRDPAPVLDALPGDVVAHGGTSAELVPHAPGAEVIVNFFAGADDLRPVFTAAPRLRWLHVMSAGVEGVLFDELRASPVAKTNARGVYARPLAEFALAGALHFLRRFRHLEECRRAPRGDDAYLVDELHGRTMAIAGYGEIGRACARLARAHGMRVIAQRRRPERSAGDDLVERTYGPDGLVELARQADVLVVAAPHTSETAGMISAEVLAALPAHAIVVNVGRGTVIDEDALADALAAGRIRGAALDVYATEPLPASSPLWALENVILSPHAADHTAAMIPGAVADLLDNLARFRAGEPLRNVFDPAAGY